MVEMTTRTKTVIVTGGGQGIGKAIARHFLINGFSAILAEADCEAGAEAEAELSSLGPVRHIPTDVANEASVREMVRQTVETSRTIDALINNAGIMISRPVTELTIEQWNHVLGVNLTGMFLCVKHCAAALRSSKGAVVNIASTRAFMSEPDTESYTASKGGVVSLTHALAVSLGPDIRVNCISPGWIEVSALKKAAARRTPSLGPADHAQHPAGRVGKAEDIAAMAFYLASGEASFMTGQNVVVDGGMTRKMIYV